MNDFKERVFKLEDYIAVPISVENDKLELSKKHFCSAISHEYWHIGENHINYSTYLLAQENKISFNAPVLNGGQVIELANVMPELEYYKTMYKVIMRHFCSLEYGINIKVNGLTFQNWEMFSDYMDTLFTDEALTTNTLVDNIVVDITNLIKNDDYFLRQHPDRDNIKANPIKKYQKGMKLTRFFTSLLEFFNKKDKESEKAVGRFRIDPNDKVKIFMSAYLPSFIKAGAVGHSCLSEGGVNEHATFMTIGYKNLLVVHDSDFSFRAWLALDHANKYFTLAHTYPRENFFLQLITYKYLESLGYKAVRNYFHFPEYMDMGLSDHFNGESVKGENRDAYNKFDAGIFEFYGRSEAGNQTIARTYGCDGCDKSSINPDFLGGEDYCESCRENDEDYGHCASCDDRYHNDDLYYDEDNEESYCSSCRDNIEEEREEKRRKEEEENSSEEGEGESNITDNEESINVDTMRTKLSDMNLQVGTNLVRSHDADTFYPTLKLMKHLPNHMTDKDVRLLSLYNSKVSNYREFMIYASLMESIGITWRDNNIASKWNPVRGSTRYPYNMNVMFETTNNSNAPHLLYNSKDEAPINELYLRYFYLAKNRLLQIKTEKVAYAMPLASANADQVPIADQLQFVSKKYSYADLHCILPLEKTSKIEFDSNAAYDMFMYVAHSVGFLWNDLTALHAKVSYMVDQNNTTKHYYEINNKGFISVHNYEDHKPDGVVTITKEMMIKLSN
jgi:hypothetical protein